MKTNNVILNAVAELIIVLFLSGIFGTFIKWNIWAWTIR